MIQVHAARAPQRQVKDRYIQQFQTESRRRRCWIFRQYGSKRLTLDELVVDLAKADLRRLTDEMIDTMAGSIANCTDADVTFLPEDPEAHDPYAENAEEMEVAWTLGHVVVHVTASAEESAFLAAELACGVAFHGRSRSEVPWQNVTAIAQCRQRLEESRRMRHASLELWPDKPYLDNRYTTKQGQPPINAVGRFVLGLRHDWDHLGQIEEIVRQAQLSRMAVT